MISTRSTLLLLAFGVLFAACKKNDDDTTPNNNGDSDLPGLYLQVKPGNYWIYQTYYVDSNGVGAPGNYFGQPSVFDSVYCLSDTTINNKVYHRMRKPIEAGGTTYDTYYLRDSLNYVVDLGGFVTLAVSDSVSTFFTRNYSQPSFSNDSFVTVSYKRRERSNRVVPAGTFPTIAMGYNWTFYPFANQPGVVNTRRTYQRYAQGVGLVSEIMPIYVSEPMYVERRLVRYHAPYIVQ